MAPSFSPSTRQSPLEQRFAMISEILKARMSVPSPYGQYLNDDMLASPSPVPLGGRFSRFSIPFSLEGRLSRLADLLASDMLGLETSPTGDKLAPIGPPVTRLIDMVRSQALASSPCHSLLTRFSNRPPVANHYNPTILETEASFVRSPSLPHQPNTGFVPKTVKKVLRPGGLAALARKGVVRGTPCAAICSVSARLAHSFLCRRNCVTNCGLGKKTPEELMVWEKSLEQRRKNVDAEKMVLDIFRLSLAQSWSTVGNAKNFLVPSGRYDLLKLKAMLEKDFYELLGYCFRFVILSLGGALLLVFSLEPGEAATIPGRIFVAVTNAARRMVLLKDSGNPPPPSPPSPLVVVMGGTPSFLHPNISELPTTRIWEHLGAAHHWQLTEGNILELHTTGSSPKVEAP